MWLYLKQYKTSLVKINILLSLILVLTACSTSAIDTINEVTSYPSPISTESPKSTSSNQSTYDVELIFPSERYPETATHIKNAIEKGESAVCTIDRKGSEANRDASLSGIPTKKGYDRDEWPMAMCEEGGSGADIAYITPSDNRGAGAWVGNALEDYADGTRVFFIVEEVKGEVVDPAQSEPIITKEEKPVATKQTNTPTEVHYANCSAVREADAAPLHKGDPGYSTKLDRDGDGVACE